uniref:Rab_C20 protein n=1 Tax=Paramecium tetraurelia TaxID=5888 RepID=Q3SDP5_PARTE|nr:rab_C20 [Paramecium tetraurelia]
MCCEDNKTNIKEQQLQLKQEQKNIKIVVLGDSGVGKTSLIQRFCFDTLSEKEQTTLGVAYQSAQIVIKGSVLKLHIWDTAGSERYRSLAQLCYRDANAAILVYNITSRQSFEQVYYWEKELLERCTSIFEIIIGLAGNKSDLNQERAVFKNEAQIYAKQQDFVFYETSSKTGEGIQMLFTEVIERYLRQKQQ